MASAEFVAAFARVLDLAARAPLAILCAEAHPSRCHRRLVSYLAALRGWRVAHLVAPGRIEEHVPHPQARLDESGRIAYPAPRQGDLGFT